MQPSKIRGPFELDIKEHSYEAVNGKAGNPNHDKSGRFAKGGGGKASNPGIDSTPTKRSGTSKGSTGVLGKTSRGKGLKISTSTGSKETIHIGDKVLLHYKAYGKGATAKITHISKSKVIHGDVTTKGGHVFKSERLGDPSDNVITGKK